jgi:hypothetical protein
VSHLGAAFLARPHGVKGKPPWVKMMSCNPSAEVPRPRHVTCMWADLQVSSRPHLWHCDIASCSPITSHVLLPPARCGGSVSGPQSQKDEVLFEEANSGWVQCLILITR